MVNLFILLAGFVAGCAAQLQQEKLFFSWIYMAFIATFGINYAQAAIKNIAIFSYFKPSTPRAQPGRALWQRQFIHGACLFALCAGLGFGTTGLRALWFQSQALDEALQGRDIRVVGIIAAMPQRSEAGLRFRLEVESAQLLAPLSVPASSSDPDTPQSPLAMPHLRLPPQLYLSWYAAMLRAEDPSDAVSELQRKSPELHAGERWALTVRLKSPHGNANPHGFDYELWLWEQGVQATGYVRATPRETAAGRAPQWLGTTWAHPLERARQHVRDAIFNAVPDARWAGVIAALVVGDQAAIERADWDVFRATGVAHLMSISGLHITMFAWAAALCVGWGWRRSMRLTNWLPAPHAALVGGVFLATAYALFSGWGVPSQRTVCMLATVAALRLWGKQWPWPLVWLLACAVVTLADPWALLQAGFWLSFVAVGVLFASEPPRRAHNSLQAVNSHRFTTLVQHTASMLREQWIITLALAPLSLLLFQQMSLVGLLANALAIPWVTLVVTPVAMLGILYAPLWQLAAGCIELQAQVLQWLSDLPFATFSVAAPALFIGVLAIFGGILAALHLPWPLRSMGAVMVLPMLLFTPPRPAQGEFELLATDIGQGNSILVRTAGHSLLYDAGPRFSRESDAGGRTLVPLLRALDERLDTLVLSHRDADHTGGAAAVLAMQTQAGLLSSLETEHALHTLRPAGPAMAASATAMPNSARMGSQRCMAGQHWQWDGVDFDILHPAATDYDANVKSNAMSCVLRISNGRQVALLTGDIEAAQEARLLANAAPIRADVLLVPHHGSKTSSTEAFLNAVQPRIALVQSGYRNRYNHPAPAVAERYAQRNIRLVQSPQCGAATWSSAAPDAVTCQREVHRRYWHHAMP